MWSKRRVCVGEQGWRDGEVEKETEVFGCMCVCVHVCFEWGLKGKGFLLMFTRWNIFLLIIFLFGL